MNNKNYFGAKTSVSMYQMKVDNNCFTYVKEKLIRECGQFLLPTIIDSGKHHVLKIDMYRDDNMDTVDFYLKGVHTIAQYQDVVIPQMSELEIPLSAKPCCQWCGNVLSFDKRGGCSACGGWPK